MYIPPNVQLLDPFHPLLEGFICRYVSALEARFPQEGLSYRVWSSELEDGRRAIGIDGMRRKNQAAEPEMECVMLRLYISWESRQIHIANLYVPHHMRHNNVGKELLRHIFKIAELELAQVYLVDIVPSFYQRMLNRGAQRCYHYDGETLVEYSDVLLITRDTRLV